MSDKKTHICDDENIKKKDEKLFFIKSLPVAQYKPMVSDHSYCSCALVFDKLSVVLSQSISGCLQTQTRPENIARSQIIASPKLRPEVKLIKLGIPIRDPSFHLFNDVVAYCI